MSVMAEETTEVKKKLFSGEKTIEMLEKRLDELRDENNSLRQTSAGKDSEIRQMNDQINELFLKLRLHEQNNIGLLDQLRNQTESEAIIVHAQREHVSTLTNLSERCNKLLQENEDLRHQLIKQKNKSGVNPK